MIFSSYDSFQNIKYLLIINVNRMNWIYHDGILLEIPFRSDVNLPGKIL